MMRSPLAWEANSVGFGKVGQPCVSLLPAARRLHDLAITLSLADKQKSCAAYNLQRNISARKSWINRKYPTEVKAKTVTRARSARSYQPRNGTAQPLPSTLP